MGERFWEITLRVYPNTSHRGAAVLLHRRRPTGRRKEVRPNDVPFGLRDIRDLPAPPIGRWLEFARKHDYLCDLYFDAAYSPTRYAHLQFLSLAQATEAYHRDCRDQSKNKKTEFGQRLTQLLEDVGPALIPAITDRAVFVRHVKDTRHYYTHYGLEPHARPIRGVESLYWLTQQLALVLAACFYGEMGFPPDRVREIMENSGRLYDVQFARDAGKIQP